MTAGVRLCRDPSVHRRCAATMATLTASLSPKPRCARRTGDIAMGKSTITSLLQNVYRIPFHDADQCVRRLYAKGGPVSRPWGGVR